MTVMMLGTVRSSNASTAGTNFACRKGILRPGFGREVCWGFFDLEKKDIELLLLWETQLGATSPETTGRKIPVLLVLQGIRGQRNRRKTPGSSPDVRQTPECGPAIRENLRGPITTSDKLEARVSNPSLVLRACVQPNG